MPILMGKNRAWTLVSVLLGVIIFSIATVGMGILVFESIDRAFFVLDKTTIGMPIGVPLWFAAAIGLTLLTYVTLHIAILFWTYLYDEWVTHRL